MVRRAILLVHGERERLWRTGLRGQRNNVAAGKRPVGLENSLCDCRFHPEVLGQAVVCEHEVAFAVDEDVGRLDVSVNNATRVQLCESDELVPQVSRESGYML